MKRFLRIITLVLCATLVISLASCMAAGNEAEFYPSSSGNTSLEDGLYADVGDVDCAEAEIIDPEENPTATPSFVENPFINTEKNNISTFSADVDTASYTYFRKLVNQGYLFDQLQKGSPTLFRTEEFINYFKYDCPEPEENKLFGIKTEMTACPWNPYAQLLRITLRAEKAITTSGNNLVFLIDVSGSMSSSDKLPLLKKAFSYLVGSLGENDRVSIVTYSGKEEVVLDGCRGNSDEMIMNAINSLQSSGSTNGQAGLTEAYRIAEKHFIEGGNNRIIMASDGDLNVGISSAEELKAFVEQKRDMGVYLSVLGFGTGNYRDSNMEALADNGNGVYYYIDGDTEAEKVLGTDILSTLYTVAEDVKLQIEFSPEFVSSYRLIGYENRILNTEDFEDDTKDAGEVGASHQVTVCYELILTDSVKDTEDHLFKLAVRHKKPGNTLSLLDEYLYGTEIMYDSDDISDDQKFIMAIIETCMLLHNSEYMNDTTIDHAIGILDSIELEKGSHRAEFKDLLKKCTQENE